MLQLMMEICCCFCCKFLKQEDTFLIQEIFVEDYLLMTAAGIERALIACNAVPDKDYTALDLMQLAQPYALERWKNGTLRINGRLLDEPIEEE